MTDLLRLAELCEKAEGADRNLDAMIHHAVKAGVGVGYYQDAPDFTGSLDAAMTLVPEEHMACVTNTGGLQNNADKPIPGKGGALVAPLSDLAAPITIDAATPALALCAAALRARASTKAAG